MELPKYTKMTSELELNSALLRLVDPSSSLTRQFVTACEALDRQRRQVRQALDRNWDQEHHRVSARSYLLSYYHQLASPPLTDLDMTKLGVTFAWADSVRLNKVYKDNTGMLEVCNLLFNLGVATAGIALETYKGAGGANSRLLNAKRQFQEAAGAFGEVRNLLMYEETARWRSSHHINMELRLPALDALTAAMLAYALRCHWEQAVADAGPPGELSGTAHQVAAAYNAAAGRMQVAVGSKGGLEDWLGGWHCYLREESKYFMAQARVHAASASEREGRRDLQIAHIVSAIAQMEGVYSFSNSSAGHILKLHRPALLQELKSWQSKLNELQRHSVPGQSRAEPPPLPDPSSHSVVPIPFGTAFPPQGPVLFHGMVLEFGGARRSANINNLSITDSSEEEGEEEEEEQAAEGEARRGGEADGARVQELPIGMQVLGAQAGGMTQEEMDAALARQLAAEWAEEEEAERVGGRAATPRLQTEHAPSTEAAPGMEVVGESEEDAGSRQVQQVRSTLVSRPDTARLRPTEDHVLDQDNTAAVETDSNRQADAEEDDVIMPRVSAVEPERVRGRGGGGGQARRDQYLRESGRAVVGGKGMVVDDEEGDDPAVRGEEIRRQVDVARVEREEQRVQEERNDLLRRAEEARRQRREAAERRAADREREREERSGQPGVRSGQARDNVSSESAASGGSGGGGGGGGAREETRVQSTARVPPAHESGASGERPRAGGLADEEEAEIELGRGGALATAVQEVVPDDFDEAAAAAELLAPPAFPAGAATLRRAMESRESERVRLQPGELAAPGFLYGGTASGVPYYICEATGESVWDLPSANHLAAVMAARAGGSNLRPGDTVRSGFVFGGYSDGTPFYISERSGDAVWMLPSEEEDAEEEEEDEEAVVEEGEGGAALRRVQFALAADQRRPANNGIWGAGAGASGGRGGGGDSGGGGGGGGGGVSGGGQAEADAELARRLQEEWNEEDARRRRAEDERVREEEERLRLMQEEEQREQSRVEAELRRQIQLAAAEHSRGEERRAREEETQRTRQAEQERAGQERLRRELEEKSAALQRLQDELARRDRENAERTEQAVASSARQSQIPHEYLCPITMTLMRDPVLAMDGHSYEREAIMHWLRRSDKSPKTNCHLQSKIVVPNHALKSMIMEWKEANPGVE